MMSKSDNNHIIILVCDNIPFQKFWNATIKDWTSNIEEATVYPTYGLVIKGIWKEIPEDNRWAGTRPYQRERTAHD